MTHYIPSNKKNEKEILDILEISTFEDLISIIPSNLRVKNGILGLESGISEFELDLFIKYSLYLFKLSSGQVFFGAYISSKQLTSSVKFSHGSLSFINICVINYDEY